MTILHALCGRWVKTKEPGERTTTLTPALTTMSCVAHFFTLTVNFSEMCETRYLSSSGADLEMMVTINFNLVFGVVH